MSEVSQHHIEGAKPDGSPLNVTLFARDAAHAEEVYKFRYGGLGYVSRTKPPEEQPQPFRKRTRTKTAFRKRTKK